MADADREVERIARDQHGFISRDQCRAAGLSDREIHGRLHHRGWRRYLPGVFLLPGAKPSAEGHLWAVQLWAGAGSILGFSSAAFVHGIDDSAASSSVHLYLPTSRRCAGIHFHRLHEHVRPQTRRVRGLVVTGVERTVLDICGIWQPHRAGKAMDAALRRRLTSLQRLHLELENAPLRGRAGTRTFRRLLRGRDHRDPSVRSEFETRMLRILRRINVGPLTANHLVVDGRSRYRLDFAYPSHRLAIECQSIRWHLGEEAYKRDMARHRRLMLLGWTVLFYPWDDVIFTPNAVESEVRQMLGGRDNNLLSSNSAT